MSVWLRRTNRWLLEHPWPAAAAIVVLPIALDAVIFVIPGLLILGAWWWSQREGNNEQE